MEDEPTATLEISDTCVIAEKDGVRAEIRGDDAKQIKERLAELAIDLVRSVKHNARLQREMILHRARAQADVQGMVGTAGLGGDYAGAAVGYDNLDAKLAINAGPGASWRY